MWQRWQNTARWVALAEATPKKSRVVEAAELCSESLRVFSEADILSQFNSRGRVTAKICALIWVKQPILTSIDQHQSGFASGRAA